MLSVLVLPLALKSETSVAPLTSASMIDELGKELQDAGEAFWESEHLPGQALVPLSPPLKEIPT